MGFTSMKFDGKAASRNFAAGKRKWMNQLDEKGFATSAASPEDQRLVLTKILNNLEKYGPVPVRRSLQRRRPE